MDTNLLEQGFTVLLVGFSVVFMFLGILICAMYIMGRVVAYLNKIFPVVSPVLNAPKQVSSAIDEEIAVAIAAALLKR